MKKLLVILSLSFLLISCNTTEKPSDSETPENPQTGIEQVEGYQLVEADISGINLKLDDEYTYLNSETVTEETATLGEILKSHPKTIVYFYPKDGTPGCTVQALEFSIKKAEFEKLGYGIIGVSRDDLDSHKSFAEANQLTIKLLKDTLDTNLLEQFGAVAPVLMTYGNGDDLTDIVRSTYIVDESGKVLHGFEGVEAIGHVSAIYDFINK